MTHKNSKNQCFSPKSANAAALSASSYTVNASQKENIAIRNAVVLTVKRKSKPKDGTYIEHKNYKSNG